MKGLEYFCNQKSERRTDHVMMGVESARRSGCASIFHKLKSETTSKLPERSFPILEMDPGLRRDDKTFIILIRYVIK
jgi:hypothetical protein